MNREFWQGKKVFLTGHTGFKGSWLSIWLHSLGAQVYGYSLPAPTEPSLFKAANVEKLVHHKIGNICDYPLLLAAMKEAQPEIVLHMAAQPLVRESYLNPIETYATNVMGTVNILEALRHLPSVKSTVIVTTDKCYENFEHDLGYGEHDPMGGYDPYSSSKGCAELVTSAMRRSFFYKGENSVASARAGNVIGGGDWAVDRLIPDFMRSFSKGDVVKIRNPHAIRPWQHVMEPLSGYMTLAEKLYNHGSDYASAWNFGPYEEDARNVNYIADKLVELWGDNSRWHLDGDNHPHEAKYLKLNINKAVNKLKWTPKFNIDECLKLTCDWYHGFYKNNEDAYTMTLNQIKTYEARK